MATQIPSLKQIKQRLAGYTMEELKDLAEKSGVGFSTLLKIKLGTTDNPGIETVRKFWPHLKANRQKPASDKSA
jgi:transcriptional regulator with XRE-family HTH domain